MRGAPTISFLALVVPLTASAQVQPKRSREPLSALEVERSLVLPKGWFEVAFSHLGGRGMSVVPSPGTAVEEWAVHRQQVSGRYGVAPHVEIFGRLPVHEVGRQDRAAIGDASFGVRGEVYRTELPSTSVAFEGGVGGASGMDPPVWLDVAGEQISLTFIRGTPSAWVAVALRRQLGPLVVGVRTEGRLLVPDDYRAPIGWMDPGDWWTVEGLVLVQAGPVVLRGKPRVRWRGPTRMRTPSELLADSAGRDLVLEVGAEVHVSRGAELGFVSELALGQTNPWFGTSVATLQPFHRFGGVLRVRF